MSGFQGNLRKAQEIYKSYEARPWKFNNTEHLRQDVEELEGLAKFGVPYFDLYTLCGKKGYSWLL